MKDIQRRLGQRIRELRIKQGFDTQEAFSEFLGVHRTVVGFWETGRKDLRLSTLIRVAEALGVGPSDLLTGLESDGQPAVPTPRSLDHNRILRDFAVLEGQVRKLKTSVLGKELTTPRTERTTAGITDRGGRGRKSGSKR